MSTEIIEEGNKLIADFMGAVYKFQEDIYHKNGWFFERNNTPTKWASLWHDTSGLQYNSSWDWLMPVCNKIIHGFVNDNYKLVNDIALSLALAEIEPVWQSVVKFVQWYQNQILNNIINHG